MISRTHLSTIVASIILLWSAILFLSGEPVTIQALFKLLPTCFGVVWFFYVLFNKYLWRLPFLYPHIVTKPNLQGTWKGHIKSSWVNPDTGKTIPPIEAYLAITQTFSSIKIRLMTTESSSDLITGTFYQNTEEVSLASIAGIYRNTPRTLKRKKSPMHHGGILIQVQGNSDFTLEGEYWTDRDTKGELCFTNRSKEIYYDFGHAAAGSYT